MSTSTLSCILLFSFMIASHAIGPQLQSSALWSNIFSNSDSGTQPNNPTSNIKINASSSLDASGITVSCFDAVQGFKAVNMANYFAAVQQILIRQDAFVSRPFYLGPTREQQYGWLGGPRGDERECLIVLTNEQPLLTDSFPVILVAHVAALIANECITEARSYAGGYAAPGPGRGVVAVGNAAQREN